MDEIVELELINLASVQTGEALADVLKQRPQLFPVIRRDGRLRLPPFRLVP